MSVAKHGGRHRLDVRGVNQTGSPAGPALPADAVRKGTVCASLYTRNAVALRQLHYCKI